MNEQHELPETLRDVLAAWGRKIAEIGEIDGELARMDVRMDEYAKALGELRDSHRRKGIQKTQAEHEAALAQHMAEQGCRRLGISMPSDPLVFAAARLAPRALLPGVEPITQADAAPESAIDGTPAVGTPVAGQSTTDTVTDLPGGDAPAEGGFQRGGGRA